MIAFLTMPEKIDTLGLLNIKVPEINKAISSLYSNSIVNKFMSPNFTNTSIPMREVITASILQRHDKKKHFFYEVVLVEVR